jgi:membrane protease YdiL (CAAX protease family)
MLAAMLSTPAGSRRVADPRLRGVDGRQAAYLVCVRIPLGTALTEEVLFRGILPALFTSHGATAAVVVMSSLSFGLWHIMPGLNRLLAGDPRASRGRRLRAVVAAVVLTTVAGLVLLGIRMATNLGVTFGLHAAINSGAALVALQAHRQTRANDLF